jgi:predicted Zn finger-like uncharacterized protein
MVVLATAVRGARSVLSLARSPAFQEKPGFAPASTWFSVQSPDSLLPGRAGDSNTVRPSAADLSSLFPIEGGAMTPFKVSCEHCDASFKISDASKIGKRVKCPKCAEPFTIRNPDGDADEEDEFGDEDDMPQARSSRRIPSKKPTGKRKKSSSKNDSPVMLWAGIGAVVVVVALGGLWAGGFLGGGAAVAKPQEPAVPKLPTAGSLAMVLDRLPAETEVLLHFRVKDALASPLAMGLRTPEFDAQLKSPNPFVPGTTVSDINTMTVAMVGVTEFLSEQKLKMASSGSSVRPTGPPIPTDPLILVALNDPINTSLLGFTPEQTLKHGEMTYYKRAEGLPPGAPDCLAIIDARLIAVGNESRVKAALDQQSASGLAADFGFLESRSHVTLAVCPRFLKQQIDRLAVSNIEFPQALNVLNQFQQKGGKTLGLQLELQTGLETQVAVLAAEEAQAGALQAEFDTLIKSARESFASPAMASNPMIGPFKDVVEAIKVTTTGARIAASASIPKETLTNVGGMAYGMAAPMISGGFGGPPTAPPLVPPSATP